MKLPVQKETSNMSCPVIRTLKNSCFGSAAPNFSARNLKIGNEFPRFLPRCQNSLGISAVRFENTIVNCVFDNFGPNVIFSQS